MSLVSPTLVAVPSFRAGDIAGTTVIADMVIAKVAGSAAGEVAGVYALDGATGAINTIRDLLSGTDSSQGISVNAAGTHLVITVRVIADYPVLAGRRSVVSNLRRSRAISACSGVNRPILSPGFFPASTPASRSFRHSVICEE